MSTPMMDNLLAAFKRTPPSPLYGKPLVYLLGSSAQSFRSIPGSVVEPPIGMNAIGTADKIAYVYLDDPDDAAGLGDLTAQFVRAAAKGYHFAELDNSAAYSVGVVQRVITMAHGYGLGIVAKNPKLVGGGALQIISHANVGGVIVERGAGDPDYYDALRRQARKDGLLPVWFVFDGQDGSAECAAAIRAGGFKGMSVSYSTGGYKDSHQVLTPSV